MSFEIIVDRKLCLVNAATGDKTDITVEIGRPRWVEPEIKAACLVFIRGIMKSPLDIYGSDLWSAMNALWSLRRQSCSRPRTRGSCSGLVARRTSIDIRF